MKVKKLLKKLFEEYISSKTFKELSLFQQEENKEKGYKGIKETVVKILGKEKKMFELTLDAKKVYLL